MSNHYMNMANVATIMETVAYENNFLAVVLNDGETFTSLPGCSIRRIAEDAEEDEFTDVLIEM